jgi:hypothetical protein
MIDPPVYVTQGLLCCESCGHWQSSFMPWTPGAHYCNYLTDDTADSLVYTEPSFSCNKWEEQS